MGLLVSIFAYFGTVAAMILAVAMSYAAFIYGPSQPMAPPQTLTLAGKPSAVKEAAKPATFVAGNDRPVARGAPHEMTGVVSAAPIDVAVRVKTTAARIASAQGRVSRRPAPQNRPHEWFAGQWPQTVGYADAPRPLFDYDPVR